MEPKHVDPQLLRIEKQIPLISSKLATAVDLLHEAQRDLEELYIAMEDPVESE